jgi:hypothetical protein
MEELCEWLIELLMNILFKFIKMVFQAILEGLSSMF